MHLSTNQKRLYTRSLFVGKPGNQAVYDARFATRELAMISSQSQQLNEISNMLMHSILLQV